MTDKRLNFIDKFFIVAVSVVILLLVVVLIIPKADKQSEYLGCTHDNGSKFSYSDEYMINDRIVVLAFSGHTEVFLRHDCESLSTNQQD